jgi:hypothetical protein
MVLVLEGVIILAIVSARMVMNNPYAQDRAVRLLRRVLGARLGAAEPAAAVGARDSEEGSALAPAPPGPGAEGPAREARP